MLRTILATTAALAFVSQSAFADDWSHHWNVSGKPELRVTTGDASVTVEAGDDHIIDAKLTTVGWSIGPGAVRVDERQTGNKVEIEVKVPPSHLLELRQPITFSFGNSCAPRTDCRSSHRSDGLHYHARLAWRLARRYR